VLEGDKPTDRKRALIFKIAQVFHKGESAQLFYFLARENTSPPSARSIDQEPFLFVDLTFRIFASFSRSSSVIHSVLR